MAERSKKNGHLNVEDVVFRDDLYPRLETSAVTVQKYAEDLSVLPPIEVNQNNELIDGWHRWTAHKKAKAEQVPVTVTKTKGDAELLERAIERNATHGLQLSQADKEKMAGRLYAAYLKEKPNDAQCEEYKQRLATLLSVSLRTIQRWTSRDDKDARAERRREIFDRWLACDTQAEIAERLGLPRRTVADELKSFGEERQMSFLAKTDRAAADHATDFDVPLYNVWKQQTKTSGSSHFGNSEVRWLDNLLYLYTEPFDVVIDPFAGGGSTVDVCRKRFRRYLVSDRVVQPELEGKVRDHDVTSGLLKPPQWLDVRLVYLDPPYWKQAEGRYSQDASDLANMELEEFHATLAGVIRDYAKKLRGAYIALLIQPTQWNAPERQFTDHVAEMLQRVKLPVAMRYSCPYESQQCTAQMVEWAKESRQTLVLTRELIVWRSE